MITSISIDDQAGTPVLLLDPASDSPTVTRATGFAGVGSPRESRRVRPQAHGGIDETRYEDGRLMTIEQEIMGTAGSYTDAWTKFDTITAPMVATWGDGNAAALKWTRSGGLALQRMVRLASEIDPPIESPAAILNYMAQFYAEDPRAYTQTETTATGAALSAAGGGFTFPFRFPFTFSVSGGGTVAFTNTGNRPTPPRLRVYGRAVNPQIVFPATGQRIVMNGTVDAGTYLELDVQARTMRIGGTIDRLNFLNAAASTWFELPPGASTLQLVADDFDGVARLDILARSAYA